MCGSTSARSATSSFTVAPTWAAACSACRAPRWSAWVVQTDWENEEAVTFLQHRLKRAGRGRGASSRPAPWTATRSASSGRSFEFESAHRRARMRLPGARPVSGRAADKARKCRGDGRRRCAARRQDAAARRQALHAHHRRAPRSTTRYLDRIWPAQMARCEGGGMAAGHRHLRGHRLRSGGAWAFAKRPRRHAQPAGGGVGGAERAFGRLCARRSRRHGMHDVDGAAHAPRHGRPQRLPACPRHASDRLLELGRGAHRERERHRVGGADPLRRQRHAGRAWWPA